MIIQSKHKTLWKDTQSFTANLKKVRTQQVFVHIKHIHYAICAFCPLCSLDVHKNRSCASVLWSSTVNKSFSNYSEVKAVNQVDDPKLYFSPLKHANKVEPYTCINTCIYNYTLIQQGELAEDSERSASWHYSISSTEYRIWNLSHKTVDPTFQLGAFILVHFSNVECSHSLVPNTAKCKWVSIISAFWHKNKDSVMKHEYSKEEDCFLCKFPLQGFIGQFRNSFLKAIITGIDYTREKKWYPQSFRV